MPLVRTEDLIDAQEVARLLRLSHRNSVSLYLRKYPDMPRPVLELGPNRPRLWLRPEVEAWLARRGNVRPGRPRNAAVLPDAETPSGSSDGNRPPTGGAGGSRGGPEPRET